MPHFYKYEVLPQVARITENIAYTGIIKDVAMAYEPRTRYQCHYNVRHTGECDGQSGYNVKKLDIIGSVYKAS